MSYEPYYSGGWQSGESGGTAVRPEALNHMDDGIKNAHILATRYGAIRTLLDNGNLANAVNQRGYTGYAAKVQKYTIDRWQAAALLEVNYIDGDGYVELVCSEDATERNGFVQYLAPEKTPEAGTPVTLAYEDESGNLTVYNCTMPASGSVGQNDTSAVGFRLYSAAEDARVALMIPPGVQIRVAWIAMYEGTFTKDDIPAFRPKDYSAELMECMRYFQIRSTGDVDPVDLRPTMRAKPTVTALGDGRYAYSAEL